MPVSASDTIIIIEDNETFSLLVTHYLKNNLDQVKVFAEHSGARAMETIQRLKPSLVVLDYYLEDHVSAKDVMEVINKMGSARPKVILFSSITDEVEKNEVLAMGIDLFVPKSNQSFYDLVRSIEALLDEAEKEVFFDPSTVQKTRYTSLILLALFFVLALLAFLLIFSF